MGHKIINETLPGLRRGPSKGVVERGLEGPKLGKGVERGLEAPQNWAQPLYYQKVFKTERFRYDSVMVLDSYQFREISRNR